jgi:putative transposase
VAICAYRFRAYPTPRQQRRLAREFGAARWVYNRGLETISRAWRERQERVTGVDFSRQVTKLKQAEVPWLKEVSSYVITQSLRDLDRAFKAFYAKRARYPRFKKRRGEQAVRYQLDKRLKNSYVAGSRLVLPRLGAVKLVWSRVPPGRPKMVTVKRDGAGRYFVSMAMDRETIPLPTVDRVVGLDAGLSAAVTFDDGTKVAPPRYLERRLKQLKRRSRDLSRAKRGSRGRARARWRLARVHARVRDCRREWLHQVSSKVVHDNQLICVEDLNVSGMLRNRHLSRALADGALAELQRQLEYKALWYGRTFVRVSRWFPSTKRCSACGFVVEKLPLSARRWTCPECGIEHDRDVNAAINIRQEGLRILELPRGPREVRRAEGETPLAGRRVPLGSGRPGKRESQESEARAKC